MSIRETATLICAIAASTPGEWYSSIEVGLGLLDERQLLDGAHDLAVAAYKQACLNRPRAKVGSPLLDAEAVALLQTGWTP